MSDAGEMDGETTPRPDDLREAALRIAACSAHPFDTAPRPGRPLTAREREIMDLLMQGMTSREIGTRLGISAVTVKNHLYRIYDKLAVRTRTEAVVKWLGAESPPVRDDGS